MSSTVTCSFDINNPGKDAGYLIVGDSTNNSGWTSYNVPIIKFSNGAGPTVLVLGGNHGDEYEGQIAASSLAHQLDLNQVQGRIIIIPCLSQEASRAGTRLWPDGSNFNRVFPGNENGKLSERLAHYLSSYLFPICDGILDMHSGGKSMHFIPSSNMTWVSDLNQQTKMINNMLAWNTDFHMIGLEQAGTNPYSLLNRDAERQGKSVSTGEFGGSGYTTPESIKIIKDGLLNFLKTFGVLKGSPQTRESLGLKPANIIFLDSVGFISATHHGIYENCVRLGEDVKIGDVVGKIHDFDHHDVEPIELLSKISGIMAVIRGFPPITIGDVVCVVGKKLSSFAEMEKVAN